MTVSEDVLRIWMADMKRYLYRYWGHPEYDDLIGSAYLGMWEAISRAEEGAVADLRGYAMRAGWNHAQAYLGGPKNPHRTWNIFKSKAVQPLLFLNDLTAEWLEGVEPDFAPRLIEQLAAKAELAKLTPRRQAALALCCLQGLTREEARLQLGWPRWLIDRVLRRVPFAAIPYAHPACGPGRRGGMRTTSR